MWYMQPTEWPSLAAEPCGKLTFTSVIVWLACDLLPLLLPGTARLSHCTVLACGRVYLRWCASEVNMLRACLPAYGAIRRWHRGSVLLKVVQTSPPLLSSPSPPLLTTMRYNFSSELHHFILKFAFPFPSFIRHIYHFIWAHIICLEMSQIIDWSQFNFLHYKVCVDLWEFSIFDQRVKSTPPSWKTDISVLEAMECLKF